jgi:outer membrane protein OmpA-like peptidoglycan-associated protein
MALHAAILQHEQYDGSIHCLSRPLPVNLMHMRWPCLVFAAAVFGTAVPALAQVTVDLHALDALPGVKPEAKGPATHKAIVKTDQRRVAAAKQGPASPQSATEIPVATPPIATTPPTAVPPPPPAALPAGPPPTAEFAPVTPAAPTEQATPPPPPPISDTATSAATKADAGLRVTFGPGNADLSPASAEAIKNFVQSAPGGDGATFNVVAFAAGTPDDPSTARRLSLSRALAVRSALMADGVTSSRIRQVRALGAAGGDEAPDRVDLAVIQGDAAAGNAGTKSKPQ